MGTAVHGSEQHRIDQCGDRRCHHHPATGRRPHPQSAVEHHGVTLPMPVHHSISELAPLTRWFDPNAARYPLRKLFTTRRKSGEISLGSTRKPRRCTKSSIPRLVVSTTPSRVGAPRREISASTALINLHPTPRRCH